MIVLSTGSLYTYGINRVFAMAAETGYDGIEVLIDGRRDTHDAAYLRRLSAEYKLPIVALHSPFAPNIHGWPHDQFGRMERTLALAKDLSVPLVVIHLPLRLYFITGRLNLFGNRRFLLPIPWPRRDQFYYFLRDGSLRKLESSAGITVAVENMPSRRFLGSSVNPFWFNSPRELCRFPHLTLDTTHLATWGYDPVAVYDFLKQRVVHVHISNFDGNEHRSPPDGNLSLDKFLRRLAEEQYQGIVTVEASPDALDADDEGKCRIALKKALLFCRDHFTSKAT